MEAYNYPIYALMYHPEYQMMTFSGDEESTFNVVNNQTTKTIFDNVSYFIKTQAQLNDNTFTDNTILQSMLFENF